MKYLVFLLLSVISLVFSACSVSSSALVQESKNTITINTNGTSVTIPTQGKETYQAGGCLQHSFFFENEKVQVDYVSLKTHCTWTGLADGYYQDFVRENIKGVVKSKSFKVKEGDIYQFNKGDKYFYLISLYNANSNLFVVDYTGDIVSKILKTDLSIEKASQMDMKLQKSLLEMYQFKGFFENSRGNEDPSLIIKP